ncbi:MAG TPA: ion channel [Puia sp.]|nr:ion channel [Puia sp.]
MATHKHINPSSKSNDDTGFGTNASDYGGRFINRDGSFNLRKEGISLMARYDIYHIMLNMPRWKFITTIFIFYFLANLVFTFLYWLAGSEQLIGIVATTPWAKFKELFFFSTETFTTVGYGRVNPLGDTANAIASIEAVSGFLSFAIATGLIYGRFAKPKSYLAFSNEALISPFRGKTALMFRFASYKENHALTDVEIRVTIGLQLRENGGEPMFKFYSLELERSRVDNLPMNWTVVHPIDDNSPLLGFTYEDMKNADVELYVLVRGFDDVYSTIVQQRTSYIYNEIIFGRKFVPMYHESDDGKTTILELHKLHDHIKVPLGADAAAHAKSLPDIQQD